MKGYEAEEIVGKHFSSFYPEEDKGAGKPERALEVATGEGLFEDEGWRVRKDGSRFWASVVLAAMRNEAGELVGFAKVTRDLTERVRNEERLHRLAADHAALEARAELERTQRVRREFLAEAGAALASSLDYRTTLATVSNLAVPKLADWCSVELVEPGATAPSQVALAHVDPSKVKFARELAERYPPNPNATTGVPEVIRSGQSALYAELPPALIEAGARDSEHLRILRELQLESAMVVPLTGRDRILGAMTFIYAASGRRYTESDLSPSSKTSLAEQRWPSRMRKPIPPFGRPSNFKSASSPSSATIFAIRFRRSTWPSRSSGSGRSRRTTRRRRACSTA